jgi:hypothetical protein
MREVYSDRLLAPWLDCLRPALPGLALFDSHTHTGGSDPDGSRLDVSELVDALLLARARAVVFPLMEPGGYPRANDRVLAEAARSEGRLVAYCRLDPHDRPVVEAERCLAAGARGIKLHPRAERFALSHPGVHAVCALAHERRLPVVVHAGRGIPALGEDAVALCSAFPEARIVLAHQAVSDLSWLWRAARELPNLFFDTAWWSASDLLALLALVPPGRVLFGSDAPYGTPTTAAAVLLRCALHAGLDPGQIAALAGAQLERLLAGEEPADLGPPPSRQLSPPGPLLERVYTLLAAALGRMLEGRPGGELLELARLGCSVDQSAPEAPVLGSVADLLDRTQLHAETVGPFDGGRAAGFHLVAVAAAVARTPDVPVPAPSEVAATTRAASRSPARTPRA